MQKILSTLILLLLVTGCGKEPPLPSLQSRQTPAADAEALGQAIEAGIREGNEAVISARIDTERILDRVTRGDEIPHEIREAFRTQFRQKLDFGSSIVAAQSGQTTYRVVGTPVVDGARRLRCRQLHSDGRVIYHDFVLEDQAKEGSRYLTRIIDIHTHSLGESYSDTLRRMYIAMALNTDRELQTRFDDGPEADYVKHFFTLQTILLFTEKGVLPSALKTHMDLPARMRAQKYMLHQQLKLSSMFSPEKEQEAIDAFRVTYPGDVSLDLYLLPRLRAKKDYAALNTLLPRLIANLGQDSYLQYLAGMARFHTGKEREGITMIQEAIRVEPSLRPAHAGLFECLVRRGEFDPAVDLLVYMKRNLGMSVQGIETGALYEDLRNSPAYTRYKGTQNDG